MTNMIQSLPISHSLDKLERSLSQTQNVVLLAPPGAGKSTGVPIHFLNSTWLGNRSILMLEPRRLAARNTAARMASLLGEPLGQRVGYQIKGEQKRSSSTRILVVTEGILTRMLQTDPELSGFGLVIFDEFHERNIHSDLGLALCLQSQHILRPDLKLLVMSATLEGETVANVMGGAPVITSEGRAFPVEIIYSDSVLRLNRPQLIADQVSAICIKAMDERTGSTLVFLPGQNEIQKTQAALKAHFKHDDTVLIKPLYGNLSQQEQDQAIQPCAEGKRKIVLATNIAETSLTIEGINIVIDSGLHKALVFDPKSGMNRLLTTPISQASATQRSGRAGRLSEGVCYRLWTASEHQARARSTPAEIKTSDLAPLVLELAQWGCSNVAELDWMDCPPRGAVAQARDLLLLIKAIDLKGKITPHGSALLELGLHPRLAHMVVSSVGLGQEKLACMLAALLSERDIFKNNHNNEWSLDLRLSVLLDQHPIDNTMDRNRINTIQKSANSLLKRLGVQAHSSSSCIEHPEAVLLAFAYPERIAKLKHSQSGLYQLSGGQQVYADESHDILNNYLVVGAIQGHTNRHQITLAAPISLNSLEKHHGNLIQPHHRLHWDEQKQRVIQERQETLGKLVLHTQPSSDAPEEAIHQILIKTLREKKLTLLDWNCKTRNLINRVNTLHKASQEGLEIPSGFPDWSLEHLSNTVDTWLLPYLGKARGSQDLKKIDLYSTLIINLSWDQQQTLDQLMPTHYLVPSGSRIAIDYSNYPPILPVRLQEMFGCQAPPSVLNQTLPLMIHLLSPAHRPVQITQDINSFWHNTYQEVRKELKIKYKKHYWPEDPFEAVATNKTKKNMKT